MGEETGPAWDKPETCGLFARRMQEGIDANMNAKENALDQFLNMIEIAMPVGWYNRKGNEVVQQRHYFLSVYNSFVSTDHKDKVLGDTDSFKAFPPKIKPDAAEVDENGKLVNTYAEIVDSLKQFDEICPMYSTKEGSKHCCSFPKDPQGNNKVNWVNYTKFMIEELVDFEKGNPASMYTKCWNAVKYLRCAPCHPNATYASYSVGSRNADDETEPPMYAMRLCKPYADIIYDNCKDAVLKKGTTDFIVPSGFSRNEFYQVVGHEWDLENGNFTHDDWFDEESGRCIDYSKWATSAGFMGMSVSSLLLAAVGVVGLVSALF